MKKRGMIQRFVLIAGILLAGLYYYNTVTKEEAGWESFEETISTQSEQLSETASKPSVICVHVCGAVKNPGVYEGEADLRLYQFIELAGGFREDASVERLNLAQQVQDGIQIYVPSKTEAESMVFSPTETGSKKLNLNTASKNELTELPGIGDAKAEAILSYRDTNGAFQKVEDLMNVPGIKEAIFEQIKDLITVMN